MLTKEEKLELLVEISKLFDKYGQKPANIPEVIEAQKVECRTDLFKDEIVTYNDPPTPWDTPKEYVERIIEFMRKNNIQQCALSNAEFSNFKETSFRGCLSNFGYGYSAKRNLIRTKKFRIYPKKGKSK